MFDPPPHMPPRITAMYQDTARLRGSEINLLLRRPHGWDLVLRQVAKQSFEPRGFAFILAAAHEVPTRMPKRPVTPQKRRALEPMANPANPGSTTAAAFD